MDDLDASDHARGTKNIAIAAIAGAAILVVGVVTVLIATGQGDEVRFSVDNPTVAQYEHPSEAAATGVGQDTGLAPSVGVSSGRTSSKANSVASGATGASGARQATGKTANSAGSAAATGAWSGPCSLSTTWGPTTGPTTSVHLVIRNGSTVALSLLRIRVQLISGWEYATGSGRASQGTLMADSPNQLTLSGNAALGSGMSVVVDLQMRIAATGGPAQPAISYVELGGKTCS
jgi:hypothetical protein